MRSKWVPMKESGAAQLLTGLSNLAATLMKLQLARKLEEGKQMVAMIRRGYEIQNERHEQNTDRPSEEG